MKAKTILALVASSILIWLAFVGLFVAAMSLAGYSII